MNLHPCAVMVSNQEISSYPTDRHNPVLLADFPSHLLWTICCLKEESYLNTNYSVSFDGCFGSYRVWSECVIKGRSTSHTEVFVSQRRRVLLTNSTASGTFVHPSHFLSSCSLIYCSSLLSSPALPHLISLSSFSLSPSNSPHTLPSLPPSSRSAAQWAAYRSQRKTTGFPLSPRCFATVFLSWQLLSVAPNAAAVICGPGNPPLHHSLLPHDRALEPEQSFVVCGDTFRVNAVAKAFNDPFNVLAVMWPFWLNANIFTVLHQHVPHKEYEEGKDELPSVWHVLWFSH